MFKSIEMLRQQGQRPPTTAPTPSTIPLFSPPQAAAFGPPPQSFAAPAFPSFAAATPLPATPFGANLFGSAAAAAATPNDIVSAAKAGDLPAVLRCIAADAACIEMKDTSCFG